MKIDFIKLTQTLRGEVLILHLTNKLQNTSNAQRIFEIISEQFKAYLKIIIVTGKLVLLLYFNYTKNVFIS